MSRFASYTHRRNQDNYSKEESGETHQIEGIIIDFAGVRNKSAYTCSNNERYVQAALYQFAISKLERQRQKYQPP